VVSSLILVKSRLPEYLFLDRAFLIFNGYFRRNTMATINLTAGDDIYTGTSGNDNVYGGAGDDYMDGGDGNDNLRGGDGIDTLLGGAGDDQLDAGGLDADEDFMYGGIGNDTFNVYEANDHVYELANEGIDTVKSWISYKLGDNVEVLRLQGTDNISGKGNELNNSIIGNDGKNSLSGGAGNDSINGGNGDDIVNGGAGNDVLIGGDGTDILTYKVDATGGVVVSLAITSNQNVGGGHGIDKISGFENLEGTQFGDKLTGDNSANKIAGLGGDDTIRGMGGNDDITAGADADTIVFESVADNGVDRIRGFATGVDQLHFNAADGYSIEGFSIVGSALFYDATQLAQFDGLATTAQYSDIFIL
jgi:serralysin